MVTFDPPEFADTLRQAYDTLEQTMGWGLAEFAEGAIDHREDGFDPHDYDDILISPGETFEIGLPRSEEIEITYAQFMELVKQVSESELIGGLHCLTTNEMYTSVEPEYADSYSLLEAISGDDFFFDGALPVVTQIGTASVRCSLVCGTTPFGFMVVKGGDWDKYFPPSHSDDYFVKTEWNEHVDMDTAVAAVQAYIFELSTSIGLSVHLAPRPAMEDVLGVYEPDATVPTIPPLRPLLTGPGLEEPISLYNKALATHDNDFRILNFVKSIEYVSQTVIRSSLNEAVRRKLVSREALDPNARFIAELESVFSDQRQFRKEREALKMTVLECCDADRLSEIAPAYLDKLIQLRNGSGSKLVQDALTQFSYSLSATRNQIAHAKANYDPTGEECPEDQKSELAGCAQVAAQQVIRWFASIHPSMRVT